MNSTLSKVGPCTTSPHLHNLRRAMMPFDNSHWFSRMQLSEDFQYSTVGFISFCFLYYRHDIKIVFFLDDLFRARTYSHSDFDEHRGKLGTRWCTSWLTRKKVKFGVRRNDWRVCGDINSLDFFFGTCSRQTKTFRRSTTTSKAEMCSSRNRLCRNKMTAGFTGHNSDKEGQAKLLAGGVGEDTGKELAVLEG